VNYWLPFFCSGDFVLCFAHYTFIFFFSAGKIHHLVVGLEKGA
jgi:hypothetical protein